MKISEKALELLRLIYNELTEQSSSLEVRIDLSKCAQSLCITEQNVKLCACYLTELSLIQSSGNYNDHARIQDYRITAHGINVIEKE